MAGRSLNKLNVKIVEALIKAAKPGRTSDGGGLFLDISDKGKANWTFIYRSPVHKMSRGEKLVGKTREKGLGSVTADGVRKDGALGRARDLAQLARDQLKDGVDPLDAPAPTALVTVPTFATLAEELCVTLEPSWRNPKTAARWRSNIKIHAGPILSKRVDEITVGDVEAVLHPIWTTHSETAAQLRGHIERVLDMAKARKYRSGENPALWRGNLSALLPRPKRLQRHHPAMRWQDVPDFMARLRAMDGVGPLCLEFAILCASRSNEARGAKWTEFDLDANIWTIPGGLDGRMKEGLEHRVPLCARTPEILATVEKLPRCKFVFPGMKHDRPLSDMTLSAELRRMGLGDITVHGFRAAFRMWAGDTGAAPREIAEQALAHKVGSAVELAYNRSTALERRRALMSAWDDYCTGAPASKVLPMNKVGAFPD